MALDKSARQWERYVTVHVRNTIVMNVNNVNNAILLSVGDILLFP